MSNLARYDGARPANRSTQAPASNETARTLAYSRQTVFACWADVPGTPPAPAGCVCDHSRSETVARGGEYLQRVTGWALGRDVLRQRVAERALRKRPDGRFEAASGWRFTDKETRVMGLVRLRPAGGDGSRRITPWAELTSDRLEVLPDAVRRLLTAAGGELIAGALLWNDTPGSAGGREDVHALAVGVGAVVAVRAQRRREADNRVGPWELDVWRAEPVQAGSPSGGRHEIAGNHRKALEG